MSKRVNIVVPIYKETLDNYELISLKQLFKILGKYPVTIVHPKKVSLYFLEKHGFRFSSQCFDDEYFDGVFGYNKLTLSSEFYLAFKSYDFILIYQTDAYVFRDDLIQWCEKGYDYVGSPWMARPQTQFRKSLLKLKSIFYKIFNKGPKDSEAYFKVGNGGFSLRKTKVFIELCDKYKKHIADKINKAPDDFVAEDVFWSLRIPDKADRLNIPDYKEALAFGFDRRPHIAYKANNSELPFGVHGINRKNRIKFYGKFIENL